MEPTDLDLPTLVALLGPPTEEYLLAQLVRGGHFGIRRSHAYVMQRLIGQDPTVTELARDLGMTQQGASKQVAEMEALGLVQRVPVEGDLRVRRVRMTARGRKTLEAGRAARQSLQDALVARVGLDAAETAASVLAAMTELVGIAEQVRSRQVQPGTP